MPFKFIPVTFGFNYLASFVHSSVLLSEGILHFMSRRCCFFFFFIKVNSIVFFSWASGESRHNPPNSNRVLHSRQINAPSVYVVYAERSLSDITVFQTIKAWIEWTLQCKVNMMLDMLLTSLIFCLLQSFGAFGFNIDLKSAVVFDGPLKSKYFGYSVALHSDRNTYW